jgi:hypothetical protein
MCPFQVIAAFERDGLSKYRTKFILTFLEHIANAHQNSLVVLSNGSRGRVVYINQSALSKPIVELSDGSTWELTADSHITGLTCGTDAISLNGYALYVGEATYQAGTASTGTAIETKVQESSGGPGGGGEPPAKPGEGSSDAPEGSGNKPPTKPDSQ